jgi:hypothetical protein
VTVGLRPLSLGLALAFLAAHTARLPQTLEDIDSINFAMGVEQFDVAEHRPHPPGYPVFVLLARLSTAAVSDLGFGWDRDEAAAAGLALLSVIAGALSVPVFSRFWLTVGLSPAGALLAAVVASAAPLFWLTASRPLSDTPGLVAAVAVQTLLIRSISSLLGGPDGRERETSLSRVALAGALGAGFAVGLRSQTLWLTGPLAVWLFGMLLWRRRFGHAFQFMAAAAVGALSWAVPLVYTTGGLAAYLKALGGQGQEDFAGVQMLATAPSWSLFKSAMGRTFIDPWQVKALAHVVLVLALCGLGALAWRKRPTLAIVMIAFLPYLALHLAFQETVTIRYALPVLVPVAGLAVASLDAIGPYAVAIGATWLVAASLAFAAPRLDLYVRDGAPVFHAFRDMHAAWDQSPEPPALKMHHQVWWGVRRIIDWYRPVWDVGRQPFPGDREWLDVVEHFRSGQRRPVWFLAHLSRPALPMFDARSVDRSLRYQFPRELQTLIGGARLDSVIWYSVRPPGWMLARGWSLTPELAGTTAQDRQASRIGATEAFLQRRAGPQRLLIGGRYLGPDDGSPVDLTVSIDDRPVAQLRATANPRWFFQWIDLPDGTAAGQDAYARLVVNARTQQGTDAGALVGLEQFDAASANESMFAFATGWHETEANPSTGLQWRWSSAMSSIEIRGGNRDRRLVISGESPLRYFDGPPLVTVRAGDRVLGTFSPSADFAETIALPADALAAASGRVTIETDRTFSPSETGSPDRRILGLRLFSVAIR